MTFEVWGGRKSYFVKIPRPSSGSRGVFRRIWLDPETACYLDYDPDPGLLRQNWIRQVTTTPTGSAPPGPDWTSQRDLLTCSEFHLLQNQCRSFFFLFIEVDLVWINTFDFSQSAHERSDGVTPLIHSLPLVYYATHKGSLQLYLPRNHDRL